MRDSDQHQLLEDDLIRFSSQDRAQVHSVLSDIEDKLDLMLFINSNGGEEFNFVGELEVRFNYYFLNEADPCAVPIERKNNVRKFKIQAPVFNPFDIGFDYQILNPLVRHLNYESNNMKKSFLVNELGLIVLNIENKYNRIKLREASVHPIQDSESFTIVKLVEIKGKIESKLDLVLEEREHSKLQLFLKPQLEVWDFNLGYASIKWIRNDQENLLENSICKVFSKQVSSTKKKFLLIDSDLKNLKL